MANNNGKNIKGYRNLSDEEIELMNECKTLANSVGELVVKLSEIDGIDQRWINIGKTDLQKGFMSVVRGIAQPQSF